MRDQRAIIFVHFLLFITGFLNAQPPFDPDIEEPFCPFSISGGYLSVEETKFHTPEVEGQHLLYNQEQVSFSYTYPFNELGGLVFGTGYFGNELRWKQNPAFTETHFGYVIFTLGGYVNCPEGWIWSINLNADLDTEEFDLSEFALYQGILWGRYQLAPCGLLHFGIITEVGLHKTKLWPILGGEFFPSPKWKIHLVYPTNLSLEYCVNTNLTIAGTVRFLRSRHRVGETEPLPNGIFEYMTTGFEFDAVFKPFRWIAIKGFVGQTTKGDLKITDRNNHNATHYKFRSAPYAGAEAALCF